MGYLDRKQYALAAAFFSKMPVDTQRHMLAVCVDLTPMESLEALLDLGVSGEKMLCSAAGLGREDVVERLLLRGVDVNAVLQGNRNEGFYTALMLATQSDHRKIVQMLLEKGANPNSLGGCPPAALHAVSEECVQLLKLSEIERLSDYVRSLKRFVHCFQIRHQAEDSYLKGLDLEGFPRYSRVFPNGGINLSLYSGWDPLIDDFVRIYQSVVCAGGGNQTLSSLQQISQQSSLSSDELAKKYQAGEGIAIHTSWPGHVTWMWLEGEFLMYCNPSRTINDLARDPAGITVSSLKDRSKVTSEVMQQLRSENRDYIKQGVVKELDLKKVGFVHSKAQKGGFCTVRSLFLLFRAIMIAKRMKEQSLDLHAASEATRVEYRKTKAAVADLQLKRLLDFYEEKGCPVQPELSLLLMALARAPERTEQVERLFTFLQKSECSIELFTQGANIFHYLKGKEQLGWMEELFGKEKLKEATPSLLKMKERIHLATPLTKAIEEVSLDYTQSDSKVGIWQSRRLEFEPAEAAPVLTQGRCRQVSKSGMPAQPKPTFESRGVYIKLLLELGADPNQPEGRGFTPLYCACILEDQELITLLCESGANPLSCQEGALNTLEEVMVYLKRFHLLPLLFSYVAEEEKQAVLTQLLNRITDIPMERWEEVITLLISMGADPNCLINIEASTDKPEGKLSLLSCACVLQSPKLVALLLDRGGNPRLRQKGGRSALEAAIYKNRFDLLELMIGFVPVGTRPSTLQSLLCWMLSFPIEHKIEAFHHLIRMGADVNQPTSLGNFPLFLALGAPNEQAQQMVCLLLEKGADPVLALGNGDRANKIAYECASDHPDMLWFLLNNIEAEVRIKILQHLLHTNQTYYPKEVEVEAFLVKSLQQEIE